MSIPKIEIKCSWFLQRYFLFNLYNFRNLQKFTSRFKTYIKPYLPRILFEIQKISGIKWEEKTIEVWIIDGFHPSISFPLLLNWYEGNTDLVTFSLIHELVHINLKNVLAKKGKTFDPILLEALVEMISKHVFTKIFSFEKFKAIRKRLEFDGTYSLVWKKEQELERLYKEKYNLIKVINRKDFEIRKGWWKKIKLNPILNV